MKAKQVVQELGHTSASTWLKDSHGLLSHSVSFDWQRESLLCLEELQQYASLGCRQARLRRGKHHLYIQRAVQEVRASHGVVIVAACGSMQDSVLVGEVQFELSKQANLRGLRTHWIYLKRHFSSLLDITVTFRADKEHCFSWWIGLLIFIWFLWWTNGRKTLKAAIYWTR